MSALHNRPLLCRTCGYVSDEFSASSATDWQRNVFVLTVTFQKAFKFDRVHMHRRTFDSNRHRPSIKCRLLHKSGTTDVYRSIGGCSRMKRIDIWHKTSCQPPAWRRVFAISIDCHRRLCACLCKARNIYITCHPCWASAPIFWRFFPRRDYCCNDTAGKYWLWTAITQFGGRLLFSHFVLEPVSFLAGTCLCRRLIARSVTVETPAVVTSERMTSR